MDLDRVALLVEDDGDICELVKIVLRSENIELDIAYDGQIGLEKALNNKYHLIILDVMLPKIDGWTLCENIRNDSKSNDVPIIMLTAKDRESDKVYGLEIGADDYISKPFSPREFLARVKALLRRSSKYNPQENQLTFGNLTVNLNKYQVLLNKKNISLTPKEFELLYTLASHKGQIFTRQQLLEKIWGYEYFGEERTVDEHVKRIRKKLTQESRHKYIHTVWGVGYRFDV
ncbi:response regulator transcription factor [Serpentinicella sp. ANB-PHB4]|uniref:response regulator transcription factor n=1 Tax=Serpentinicella sp. ANB-PHB4 TaxID=3074076 RepID=UPI002863671C|nr:response regulator transcription factor [Serpentinicella sp. ANB-PHB4]MDR5658493.1 response regulator transcription factor [Serpentinicella sp. ANB-PHB4]